MRNNFPVLQALALRSKWMFIAVYALEIKQGTEASFREACKAIYQHCGCFGSRLHTTDKSNI